MVSKSWFWHIFTTAVLRRMRLGDQNDTNWVTGWYRLEYLWVLPIYLQKQGSIIHERCERHPKRYTNEKGSEALSATNGLCGLRGYRFWGVPNRLCSFREPVHPTTYTPFGNGRFARFTECIPARNVLQLVCPWGTCERVVVERWKKQRSPCDWKFGLTLADLKRRVLEHLAWLTPRIKTALQDDEGYLSQIPFPLHLCARCFRVFQKIPASVQIVHALCNPNCLHWPLIC